MLPELLFHVNQVNAFAANHGLIRKVAAKQFSHSDDFRSVNKDGIEIPLTSMQAQVIDILWNNFQNGTPDVSQAYIINMVSPDTDADRLRDVCFATKTGHETYQTLIEPGKTKGTIRLKL